jgi:adenosylcobyric acid synthase
LLGQVSPELSAMAWRSRGPVVWPLITKALDELRAENDVVVIEGAGSPAEINLAESDVVNMRVAEYADARCLLVTDIDRGGAFAHLYGTWALLEQAQRTRIQGFVLNKFRGDAALLAPGPQMLRELTGIETVATVPMWRGHGLPEEDGMFLPLRPGEGRGEGTRKPKHIAIVAYPRISNLDEFQPLNASPGVRLTWARTPADLAQADWIVLPGSKNTSSDLAWLRAQGLGRAIAQHAQGGGAVLGICGGLQMLGEALIDHEHIEGNAPGLGLLPLVTVFERDKTVRRTRTQFAALSGPWQALSGLAVSGYEIHHGRSSQHAGMAAARAVLPGALGWQNEGGNVLGVYLHGLFEHAAVLRALFGSAAPTLDSVFDGLADFIERHFRPGVLQDLVSAPANENRPVDGRAV